MKKPRSKRPEPHPPSPVEIQILEAFIDLCATQGAANVTLQKVATRAEVAFSTVRYYFAGEDNHDLTQAAILYVAQSAYSYIEAGIFERRSLRDFDPLQSYVEVMFDWIRDNPSHGTLFCYFYYLCATGTRLALANDQFLSRARSRILSLIHESVGRGTYPAIRDAEALSLKVHANVLGGCVIALSERRKAAVEEQKTLTRAAVEALVCAHRA